MKQLPNIIIVEGIDRVGKTTLVNKIANELGYKIFEDITPTRVKEENYHIKGVQQSKQYESLSMMKLIENDYIIFDRFHLTEAAYGEFDRGYRNREWIHIDNILKDMNVLLVYVRPTHLTSSSEQHGSSLVQHHEKFEHMFRNSKMAKMKCMYQDFDNIILDLKNLERNKQNENI